MKLGNDYARAFGRLFDDTPKAVFAAIALSLAFQNVEEAGWEEAVKRVLKEWETLHVNGIIPQQALPISQWLPIRPTIEAKRA